MIQRDVTFLLFESGFGGFLSFTALEYRKILLQMFCITQYILNIKYLQR